MPDIRGRKKRRTLTRRHTQVRSLPQRLPDLRRQLDAPRPAKALPSPHAALARGRFPVLAGARLSCLGALEHSVNCLMHCKSVRRAFQHCASGSGRHDAGLANERAHYPVPGTKGDVMLFRAHNGAWPG